MFWANLMTDLFLAWSDYTSWLA